MLDFPLNPPDGDGVARGGVDFGIYRNRYEKYHTGEDWWTSRGGSFGTPVYSVGHGRVTYAAPLGWGRDQGVLIIRHTFEDGRQILSFYGHLDPPSVSLAVGECVARGQRVGNIGRPRTSPHLHFEIRTQMPNEPGGGYWWQDPTLAGWLPPSETIWQVRMARSPGVKWLRAPEAQDALAIGAQDENTFLMLENNQIVGLNAASGDPLWVFNPETEIVAAVLDTVRPVLYVADQAGRVEAYRLSDAGDGNRSEEAEEVPTLLWQLDLDVIGVPELIPFPGGGFMMAAWYNAIGVSDEGQILWQSEEFDRLLDWVAVGDDLLISTISRDQSLWAADEDGLRLWKELGGGALASLNDLGLLFNSEGLFRLNPADESSTLLSEWPTGAWRGSDVLGLEDGGALVTYFGRSDSRLIRFDADGVIIWQRSFPEDVPEVLSLFRIAGQPFIWAVWESGDSEIVSVYEIDREQAGLTLLFSGGTRTATASLNSLHPSDSETLFVNIGGGHLVSLDLNQAADLIDSYSGSPAQKSNAAPSEEQGT